MSQITTHVLDTSIGKPAMGITIHLEGKSSNGWNQMAQGITNADGRIGDLLEKGKFLPHGTYRMIFETASYFTAQNKKGFYPSVTIEFNLSEDAHYHIPLLLNPFGYSTYRGS
ncbi:MAG: hydroxyisourate hydrolase [Bacteroidetes bacterium]|nr:hydroxyisourate hydrolase [Bacteroidota bacterium]